MFPKSIILKRENNNFEFLHGIVDSLENIHLEVWLWRRGITIIKEKIAVMEGRITSMEGDHWNMILRATSHTSQVP